MQEAEKKIAKLPKILGFLKKKDDSVEPIEGAAGEQEEEDAAAASAATSSSNPAVDRAAAPAKSSSDPAVDRAAAPATSSSNPAVDRVNKVCTVLLLFLTIPVTVATAERSFFKLKLIKSYLRSTMGQGRLSGLATLSIENHRARQLDLKDIINDFAERKSRKIQL